MNRYKAYIFDFDLTLADSSEGILICFKHVLKEFGYRIPDDMTIYNTIGMTLADAFDLLTGIPCNPEREDMRKAYVKKADEVMVSHTYFYGDTISIMQSLRDSGAKVGIVSTKFRYRIEQTFEAQAHTHPYDAIVGGEDVSAAKPDPQGLRLMLERLGISESDALYIGDSYIDAGTAQNACVDFAGVLTGPTTRSEFNVYPNIYIGESLRDILSNI